MKKIAAILFPLVGVMLVLAMGVYGWASIAGSRSLARTIETDTVDFPIPFPLSEEELSELEPGASAMDVALARAVGRGRHLVESRYACAECHGADFGGGVMVDDPAMGQLLGPNLTLGEGSRTLEYGPADWDRMVRHGVKPDGAPGVMPSEDFQLMSDQELSDVVAYLRSMPPVDAEVPVIRFGPVGKLMLAFGVLRPSADLIGAHDERHVTYPPPTEVSPKFGRHLAGVCTGCHGFELTGGPIANGDPSWPPARNLTVHDEGLAGWTFEDFETAMLRGLRPDGTTLLEPMTLLRTYAQKMTDVEMRALWAYL